ncbi:MAG: hypothetical protein ABI200_02905, partial [Gaiellales bacterium]
RTLAADERYELDELGLSMVGVKSGHAFRIGDPIDVYVDAVDRATGRVELRRLPPGVEAGDARERARAQGSDRAGSSGGSGRGRPGGRTGGSGRSRGGGGGGGGGGRGRGRGRR